jgi:hypothetical protein
MASVAATEHFVRFTAGSDPGPRSGVWRIFTYSDEIYVLPRYGSGTEDVRIVVELRRRSSGLMVRR